MHNFFTKYNKSQNQIFVSQEDADKYTSEWDLSSKGKKTQYKGIPKYDFRTINLFPFKMEVDFTMNDNYTEEEKKRMSVPAWCYNKKTVNLIGIYERIISKGGNSYTSCCGGGALTAQKIISKQKGLSGKVGRFYYIAEDKQVIEFFESRGFETIKNSNGQRDRISFVINPKNEEEANLALEAVYDFDKKFKQ